MHTLRQFINKNTHFLVNCNVCNDFFYIFLSSTCATSEKLEKCTIFAKQQREILLIWSGYSI